MKFRNVKFGFNAKFRIIRESLHTYFMQLSKKQKDIYDDPLYWEWFQKWWDKDYSYDNLKNHEHPDGKKLSDFYNDARDEYIVSFAGKRWHPINTPPHDPKGDLNSNLDANKRYFNHNASPLSNEYLIGFVRNDWRPSVRKIFVDCHLPTGIAPNYEPNNTSGCLWSVLTGNNFSLGGDHDYLYLLNRPREINSVSLTNSVVGKLINYFGVSTGKYSIINCVLPESIILRGKSIRLEKPKVKNLRVSVQRDCNFSFIGRKTHNQTIRLFLDDAKPKSISLGLKEVSKSKFILEDLSINMQQFDDGGLRGIEIINCQLFSHLDLSKRDLGSVEVYNSTLREGLNISDSKVCGRFILSGVTSSKTSNFRKAVLYSSAQFLGYLLDDSSTRNTVLQNSDFRGTEFYDNTNISAKLRYEACVNFNDVEFVGTTRFEKVLFEGVPKFHGATIHSETSFDGFRPSSEYKNLENLREERLQDFQSAYRSLRQHMETISNFSQAAEFGVLEMRAKQHRKNRKVVPTSVAFATRIYGKLANYGQSFVKPLYWLAGVWTASVFIQLLLFLLLSSDCMPTDSQCALDLDKSSEATKRASTFGIPPITVLIKRTVEQDKNLDFSIWLQLSSSFFMLLHALIASLLVFLIGLSLKRRLQMR